MANAAKSFSAGTSPLSKASPKKGVATGIVVNSNQANVDSLDITGYRFFAVKPSANVTTLTFYGSETLTGTYVLINDLGSSGIVTLPASKWTVVDGTKIAPHSYIQMVSDQASATVSVCAST